MSSGETGIASGSKWQRHDANSRKRGGAMAVFNTSAYHGGGPNCAAHMSRHFAGRNGPDYCRQEHAHTISSSSQRIYSRHTMVRADPRRRVSKGVYLFIFFF